MKPLWKVSLRKAAPLTYIALPGSQHSMSFYEKENQGIGFCKEEAKTFGQLLFDKKDKMDNGQPKIAFCDVTDFHQVAAVVLASFQSSLFY